MPSSNPPPPLRQGRSSPLADPRSHCSPSRLPAGCRRRPTPPPPDSGSTTDRSNLPLQKSTNKHWIRPRLVISLEVYGHDLTALGAAVAEKRISSCCCAALCSLSSYLWFLLCYMCRCCEAGRVIRIDKEQLEAATIAGLAAYRDLSLSLTWICNGQARGPSGGRPHRRSSHRCPKLVHSAASSFLHGTPPLLLHHGHRPASTSSSLVSLLNP